MEGIYLIQEREFIKTKEDVYTIGRSNNLSERIKQYPKESKLILIILCKNSSDVEKKLITILTKKFKLCSNYGAEYFEGKLNKIITEIENYFKNIKSLFCKIKDDSTNNFNFKCITNNKVDDNILTKTIYPIIENEDNNESNNESNNDNNSSNESDTNKMMYYDYNMLSPNFYNDDYGYAIVPPNMWYPSNKSCQDKSCITNNPYRAYSALSR